MQAKESPLVGALNCMHDQQAVMTYESAGFKPRNGANSYSTGYEEEKAPTISTDQNYSVVTYGLDRASFNQGKNAMYDISVQEEIAQPIVARGPGGGTATVGSLCARDYKGVGNQYVDEGKVIVQRVR